MHLSEDRNRIAEPSHRAVVNGIDGKTLYIKPGSPWENGHIESFHDKLRGECLNRELFGSLLEAQIILEQWRAEYNDERPHSSLRHQTPSEYARRTATAADANEKTIKPQTNRRTPV